MSASTTAQQSLEALLSKLGFSGTIQVEGEGEALCLQIVESPDADYLIGQEGDRLDDLQYIVNRMTQKLDPESPRVRVDCHYYRAGQEERLVQKALELADRVLEGGKPLRMNPLNAYHRRLVHNALMEVEGIGTESPETNERFKRITIYKL